MKSSRLVRSLQNSSFLESKFLVFDTQFLVDYRMQYSLRHPQQQIGRVTTATDQNSLTVDSENRVVIAIQHIGSTAQAHGHRR